MENNVTLFENKALVYTKELSNLEKQVKELTKLQDEQRAKLLNAMQEYGIKSFENDYVKITVVKASTSTSIDLKALEKAEPECYNGLLADYPKVTERKESIRISIK